MEIVANAVAGNLVAGISNFTASKFNEFFKDGNKNVALEDILNSESGQRASRIALDYLKRSPIPDNDLFSVLKALLVRIWNSKDDEARNLSYFAEIVSRLEPIELHVLFAAFKFLKSEDYVFQNNIRTWSALLHQHSNIPFRELIDGAVENLIEKRLLMASEGKTFVSDGTGEMRNNLSKLGFSIVEMVYDEVKISLKN